MGVWVRRMELDNPNSDDLRRAIDKVTGGDHLLVLIQCPGERWSVAGAVVERVLEGEIVLVIEPGETWDPDADEEESVCRECGVAITDNDGWDGMCGNCADQQEVTS